MTALADLELPTFDYLDPELRGERFHAAMAELRRAGLAGDDAAGRHRRRPRGRRVLPAQRAFTFPGMKIAEIFGIDDGPLFEEIRRNILHVNGPDHRRLRGLVNPAFTPRAVERWRPAMRALPRGALEDLRRRDPLRRRRGLRQALPLAGDRDRDGRAARGRRAAVGLVALDPAPVRHEGARGARADRAGGRGVLRVRRRAARRRRAEPGDDLISHADRRRAGGRPAVRRRAAQPRAQRARRRRRHDPEPARPRAAPVRRAPRTSGRCWPSEPELAPRPSRRSSASSRSRRSPPGSRWRRSPTAT